MFEKLKKFGDRQVHSFEVEMEGLFVGADAAAYTVVFVKPILKECLA